MQIHNNMFVEYYYYLLIIISYYFETYNNYFGIMSYFNLHKICMIM